MSHSGKRFLSGLVNRVFSSNNNESRATAKRRERSLSARRLGMEPLEDRQLLAVDPILMGAAAEADSVSTPEEKLDLIDVSSVAPAVADIAIADLEPTITVNSHLQDAVPQTGALETSDVNSTQTHLVNADISARLNRFSCDEMGWAATLSNMLTYTGWSVSSVVDPTDTTESPEQQTFEYFTDSFTNATSSIYYAYAWFMGGSAEYVYQGDYNYSQLYSDDTHGGLFTTESGEWREYSYYMKEIKAADIASPLYGISTDYLDNNYAVGVEVHYADALGNDVTEPGSSSVPMKSWLTYWGYEYDPTYNETDKEYFTAVYMSNPDTGEVERMSVQWDNLLNAYKFTNYDQSTGRTPYVYSFTVLQRMPGYGVLIPDAYEPNNAAADFESGTLSDLGVIDVVTPSSQSGTTANGNTFTLENLTLYAQGTEDGKVAADPVDLYKFELTQTASHSDSVVVEFTNDYLNFPLKATLYLCADDGEALPIDPEEYGMANGFYDASTSNYTKYTIGEDGKLYSEVVYQKSIKLTGLTAGKYYLQVEFEDGAVGGVNSGYNVTFNAGYDDVYETNNSFAEVNELPVSTPKNPTSNLGVVLGNVQISDLVLKQYSKDFSETDWYRFETTATGDAKSGVRLFYEATYAQDNDSDLDLYLYKADESSTTGYKLVGKAVETKDDFVSMEGMEPGVYYVKVVGFYEAGNVEYKLGINVAASDNIDVRPEVPSSYNWATPLVVSSEKYVPNSSETYESEVVIGLDGNVYWNYAFAVYGSDKVGEQKITLGLFVNGERVEKDLLIEQISKSGLDDSMKESLLELFTTGKSMGAGENFVVSNFNLGKIGEEGTVASLFGATAQAKNSIVVAINPDNYEFGENFGKIEKVKGEERQVTLAYNATDGEFYDGSTLVVIPKGETIEVYRNGKFVDEIAYGVDKFKFQDGDLVLTTVSDVQYQVNTTSYVLKEEPVVKEYVVDNNFSSTYFFVNDLREDVFAPNASIADVVNNTNPSQTNPDLGVANIENLTQEEGTDRWYREIKDLVITGETDKNGNYISDWFKFELKSGKERNYEEAFVEILFNQDEDIKEREKADLDLYLYKIVQDDPNVSFDEAYASGAYKVVLISSSKGVGDEERINFFEVGQDGKRTCKLDDGTYFIRVSGFNGNAGRYSLKLDGFTTPTNIEVTDPSEYFTDDCVSVVNSVATLNWKTPSTDYVSRVTISYREVGAEEWTIADYFKASAKSCKIADLNPNTEYEFQLTAENSFGSKSASVKKTTDNFLNETVYRAIIVGVSDYPGTAADLVAASNDAKAIRDKLLEDPQWASENIVLLTDAEATRDAVLNAFETMKSVSDDNDVLLFYFAGSGTSASVGGKSVGYLKTFGSSRKEYLSSEDLLKAAESVAAGSKQFILDAGQVAKGVEQTAIDYDAFIKALTASKVNGDSDRVAQTTVLTSGQSGTISSEGTGNRSIFNRALTEAIDFYSYYVEEETDESSDPATEKENFKKEDSEEEKIFNETDRTRVNYSSIFDYISKDIRVVAYEMVPTLASSGSEDAVIMNGYWNEKDAFNQEWLDAGAIVVTSTVDAVDAHDGKVSLREAANLIGSEIPREKELSNGDAFVLSGGSKIKIGVTEGRLVDDVEVVYSNGGFKTNGTCVLQVGEKTVEFNKIGNVVSWTQEDWESSEVVLTDEEGLAVGNLEYLLDATTKSAVVDKEEFTITRRLEEGDVLTTALEGGKEYAVTKVGNVYKLVAEDGSIYSKTTGLYYKESQVTLSTQIKIEQSVKMTKVVFADSLAGQALTTDRSGGAIVFENGGIVDATSLKGELFISGKGSDGALIRVAGNELVTFVGFKITDVKGVAISVDEGAYFELANSLIYRNDGADSALIDNQGSVSFVNCTVANNKSTLVAGSNVLLTNSIVALNDSIDGFEHDETSIVSKNDPGFVDAENDDYQLTKDSEAVDIGVNSGIKLQSGFVLEFDLAGDERIGTAGTIDAGAYEFAVAEEDRETPSTVVTTLEDIVDPTDGEISLREAIAYAGTTYQAESELKEGEVVKGIDGTEYEVKKGRIVSFEGVSAVQKGTYYTVEGVYVVDAYGEYVLLEEGTKVTVDNGLTATVVGTKLQYASGVPVEEGALITTEDGVVGNLSYGAVTDFVNGRQILVNLTASVIDPTTPVSTFDEGAYILTYQTGGNFKATLQVTTTDSSQQSTTTEFEATFKLVAGVPFTFIGIEGEETILEDSGVIARERAVNLEDGNYTLVNDLTEKIEGKVVVIYQAGAQFTLKRGVFADADGNVVNLPKGTELYSSAGTVVFQSSNFVTKYLEEGTVLICDDGTIKLYKEDLTVYEEITLGKTITFKKGLASGTISLEKGAIPVERAVTINASLIGGLTIDAHEASRVFTIDAYREANANAYVNLSGFTLINGDSTEGGLIYVEEGSNLRLTDSTLADSDADEGGAIYNAGKLVFEGASKPTSISNVSSIDGGAAIYNVGTLNVTNVSIDDARAHKDGGAIYNGIGASATLAGVKITNAKTDSDGGAVYNAGTLTISKSSELTSNSATNGGAVYNVGVFTSVGSKFQDNKATNGAAIYNAAGKVSLTTANILGNVAQEYGGAIFDAAQFFATRTVIANNDAKVNGGAIYSNGSTTIVDSLILANGSEETVGNYAVYGDSATLFFTNNTIVGNKQAGVYLEDGVGTSRFYNTIIGDNVGSDFVGDSADFDVKYSMVQTTAENLDATNPGYAPSFTKFDVATDWSEWNLRPASGSATIDAGSVDYAWYYNFSGVKTVLTTDFVGSARLDGDNVDIGAYESGVTQETASTVVTTLEDILDPTDGLISLREAIGYAASGKTVADRTVTFSNDLFSLSSSATVELESTIIIGGNVIVTSAYVDEFGDSSYWDITVANKNSDATLFVVDGGADVEMRGLTFTKGRATGDNTSGGAFIIRGGSTALVDCVVTGNVADRNGGAVYMTDGTFFAVNSLFYENAASSSRGYGGAFCITGGQAYIYNCTITDNTAGVYGGVFASDGLVVLANSIVARNGGAQNVDVYATNLDAHANLIGAMDAWKSVGGFNGNIVGTPSLPVDPKFVDFEANDFSLQNDSLAANAGLNAYAFGPDGVRLKFDLNAEERIVGGVVDMGAFESQYAVDVPSTVVTTLADVVDQTDGLISLREAIEYAKQLQTPITFNLTEQGDDDDKGDKDKSDEEFEGQAEIRLEGAEIEITDDVIIDASNLKGGLTIFGGDSRIFNVNGGKLTLKNVALTGGYETRGGAIYMSSGELNLTNVLIYGNDADEEGGAIYAKSGKGTFLNTTIAGNDAGNYQGVYFNGTLNLQNTIIAANAKESSVADYNFDLSVNGKISSIASIVGLASNAVANNFNGVNGNVYGSGENIVDPGFVAAESNDFTLTQDSIAVNTGSNRLIGQPGYYASILQTSSNAAYVRTDFAGDQRLVGSAVDVGAYEFQTATENPSVVVTTLDDVVDAFDGKISLREALDYAGSAYVVDGEVTKVGRTITFDSALANGVIKLQSTLEITKCVTIDATDLQGSLTLAADFEDGQDGFNALTLNAVADSVQSEVYVCGLGITGGKSDYGAGVYHLGGDATLLNCAIYGNEANYGAGVASAASNDFDASSSLRLVNVTVTKNDAKGAYGGIWTRSAEITLHNTIVAQNTTNGENGADISISNVGSMLSSMIGIASGTFAREYDGENANIVGTADSPASPSFNDYENDDFTLARDADGVVSVAVNAGDNTLCVLADGSVPTMDAGNSARIVGGVVDMGAFESELGPTEIPSLMVTTAEDVVDPYDGLISLREATIYANSYGLAGTICFAERLSGSTIYLNETLRLSNDITIDGLANGVVGITLTTADSVEDQRILLVDGGATVINGVTITNRYSERLRNGGTLNIEQGGAVYVRTGTLALYNTLMTDNAAESGAAIYVNENSVSATVTIVNSTIIANVGLTDDVVEGAAIYSERGVVNLWNTIVATNKLDDGTLAQDVYKGSDVSSVDVATKRDTVTITDVPEYEDAIWTFVNGDEVLYNYQTLTYQDGEFYTRYGEKVWFAIEDAVSAGQTVELEYRSTGGSNGWFVGGVVYDLAPQTGDAFQWTNSATGQTSTLYYYNGEYRLGSMGGKAVSFTDGDRLVATARVSLEYHVDGFHRLNVVQTSSGWFRRDYSLTTSAAVEYAQQVLDALRQDLVYQTSYTKVVNGVKVTYPIKSASVEITGYSAEVRTDLLHYTVDYTYAAAYTYETEAGVTVLNTFVSISDSLASLTSGAGSFIGTTSKPLTRDAEAMFVDAENGDYHLTNLSLATNAGNNSYFNQGTINGTFDSLDIEGNPRVYYTTVDMGAFENQEAKDSPIVSISGKSVTLQVTTGEDDVDSSDGVTSLREALLLANSLYERGYENVTINVRSAYKITLDRQLGSPIINAPVVVNGACATIDCNSASNAFVVDTDGKVVLSNLIITNGALTSGAGVKLTSGDLTLSNCLIYGCEATVKGGAIYTESNGTLALYNTTIAKNVAVDGCGIYGAKGSKVELYNSIIAENRCSETGVDVTDVSFYGDFAINASLIGNAGSEANQKALLAKSVASKIGYGVDDKVDPLFVKANDGNFRISATASPAKNAGSSEYVYPNSHDLDGNYLSGAASVSMGAYQIGTEARSTVVTTLEDVVDPTDGLISLREAIDYASDNIAGAGCGSIDNSSYNTENAMNNPSVYSATYLSPITFDESLAGGTIKLHAGLMFDRLSGSGSVYDTLIDASALSGLGGITIDCSEIVGGMGGAVFQVIGQGDPSNGIYMPVHLDVRNVNIVGSGRGTAFSANMYGMVTLRNCLVAGFGTGVSVGDNDSDQAGVAHIYNTTIDGNIIASGPIFIYNSLITGVAQIPVTQNNPAYRRVDSYSSFINGYSGLARLYGSYKSGTVADQFVDYANGDYRLNPVSLCVNSGDAAYVQTLQPTHAFGEVDLNGNPRIYSIVDIGCYESTYLDIPSTTVTTTEDVVDHNDGLISLREAIDYAVQGASNYTVYFSEELSGETVELNDTVLLTRFVSINGGANDITIDGNRNGSLFEVKFPGSVLANGINVYFTNLKLTGGYTTGSGGAINIVNGNVSMTNLWIYGNEALDYGGAVYAYDSELTFTNCRIGGNTAAYYGGVVNQYGRTVMNDSYVAENVGTNPNAGADLWGLAPVNYTNSKRNVIGYIADNVTISTDPAYNNRVGTAETPIRPFVNSAIGNLEIKDEWAPVNQTAALDSVFANFAEGDDVVLELSNVPVDELNVFDDDWFESLN